MALLRFPPSPWQRTTAVIVAAALLLALLWQLYRPKAGTGLRIATWNMQWLVTPETAHRSRMICRAGQRAELPCDNARQNARNSADFARLRHYVKQLNADVIAFQEVENAAIAARIFRGYSICISRGAALQQLGFAIRKRLSYRCGEPQLALALGNARLRPGMAMQLAPGTRNELLLLTVHLKSGCARAALASANSACATLAQQTPLLSAWMHDPQRTNKAVIVLGDFNRQAALTDADDFWQQLLTTPESGSVFVRVGAKSPFHNCFVGQGFSSYIDHILANHRAISLLAPGSFEHLPFETRDVTRYQLSDHCPVTVRLGGQAP
jgi:endonuclease/exonuclease/phosphatase family metal-dependent hydrolase